MDRVKALLMPEHVLEQPGIATIHDELGFMVIDGDHRLAKRYMSGRDTMLFYLVSSEALHRYETAYPVVSWD